MSTRREDSADMLLQYSSIRTQIPCRTVKLTVDMSADGFLRRLYKCGFTVRLSTTEQLLFDADNVLFRKVLIDGHCLHHLLPPVKTLSTQLRPATHIVNFPFTSTCYTNGPFLYVVFLTVINLYPILVFFVFFSIYDLFLLYVYTFTICSCHVVLKVYLLTYLLTYLIMNKNSNPVQNFFLRSGWGGRFPN